MNIIVHSSVMLIRVDMRETDLFGIFQMNLKVVSDGVTSKPTHSLRSEALPVGDVILSSADGETDYIVFERKSLADLAASIRDGRYKEQSLRLQAFPNVPNHNVVYIIEGDFARYNERFSKIGKGALQSAMCSLNYYKGFSVVRTMSVLETYELVHSYANKLSGGNKCPPHPLKTPNEEGGVGGQGTSRAEPLCTCSPPPYCSVLKVKQVKCENITPQNIAEIMLCNIPSVSSKTAAAIVKKYPTMRALMDALNTDGSETCLADIRLETQRKLSKQCISNIHNFLMA